MNEHGTRSGTEASGADAEARSLLLSAPRLRLADISERAPSTAGIYAWWSSSAILGGIPGTAHVDSYLYYIGIADRLDGGLRERLREHAKRTTRRSTERVAFAALLAPEFGWPSSLVCVRKAGPNGPAKFRAVLREAAHEEALSAWMAETLQVSWIEWPEPKRVERDLVKGLRPALNLTYNTGHSTYRAVKASRVAFRGSASVA